MTPRLLGSGDIDGKPDQHVVDTDLGERRAQHYIVGAAPDQRLAVLSPFIGLCGHARTCWDRSYSAGTTWTIICGAAPGARTQYGRWGR